MSTDRRFTEAETARILEQAARFEQEAEPPVHADDAPVLPSAPGLSLHDLQAIAAEAGINPRAVARAAEMVARGDLVPTQVKHATGVPIALARTIRFDCDVSDATWARMVVLLQETFAARGRLRTEGALREWSNGNLHAVLEPTPQGHQLRISTRKGNAAALRTFGNLAMVGSVAVGGIMLAVNGAQGAPPPEGLPWLAVLVPGFMGLGARLQDVLSRRAWGRERVSQLDALPAQLRALLPPATANHSSGETSD
ncbi:hypothetical protein [Gemmatimonas sp.]